MNGTANVLGQERLWHGAVLAYLPLSPRRYGIRF